MPSKNCCVLQLLTWYPLKVERLFEKIPYIPEEPKQPYVDGWNVRRMLTFAVRRQGDAARRKQTPREPSLKCPEHVFCLGHGWWFPKKVSQINSIMVPFQISHYQDPYVKKLFKLIEALRHGKKFQKYAPNNSDQVSSDEKDPDDPEDSEEEGSLTASEFEPTQTDHDGTDVDRDDDDDDDGDQPSPKSKNPPAKGKTKAKGSDHVVPKSRHEGKTKSQEKKTKSQEKKASPVRGSCSVGGSSGSGRSKEQIAFDHVMLDIAELEAKVILVFNHADYF